MNATNRYRRDGSRDGRPLGATDWIRPVRYVVRWAELEHAPTVGAPEVVVGGYFILDRCTGDYMEGIRFESREDAERALREWGLQ